MSTEKFKIYLPAYLKSKLEQDALLFEFRKKSGKVNLNALLKQLLVNYIDEYSDQVNRTVEHIQSLLLARLDIGELASRTLSTDIASLLLSDESPDMRGTRAITLTVSGRSLDVVQGITAHYLNGSSLSRYLREMFESFEKLPRNRREEIVFKETFDVVRKAILLDRDLDIVSYTSNGPRPATVAPYAVVSSKEEMFNYLLCYDLSAKVVRSYRMSRLGIPIMKSSSTVICEEPAEKLELARTQAPQFSFQDCTEARVLLTEEGKRKYSLIYTNRPVASSREGDTYVFYWPLVQLLEYFKRFGSDAIVLSPIEGVEEMLRFHADAARCYMGDCGPGVLDLGVRQG